MTDVDPRIAPPPPGPRDPLERGPLNPVGFEQSGRRTTLEIGLVLAFVVGIGAGVVYFGGLISALLLPLVPLGFDAKLGELSTYQLTLTQEECRAPEAQAYVEEVARPLLEALGPTPFPFRFRVVDDKSVNAFALPGGYVTVNSGLLEAAESGEEVAGVLGHELWHVLERHSTARMLREMSGGLLLSVFLGGSDLYQLSAVVRGLTGSSYDRQQESDADRKGTELLVRARIDPSGLARFFERLRSEGLQVPELLSSHPDPGARAEALGRLPPGVIPRPLPAPPALRCQP